MEGAVQQKPDLIGAGDAALPDKVARRVMILSDDIQHFFSGGGADIIRLAVDDFGDGARRYVCQPRDILYGHIQYLDQLL